MEQWAYKTQNNEKQNKNRRLKTKAAEHGFHKITGVNSRNFQVI